MFLGREKTSGLVIKKNREVIEHCSVTLSIGPHLVAPYRFWKHTNNTTGKESVFLNMANNNFLEGTNYNYSCIPVTSPGKCKTDYVMPELRTINSMPNIPSCATVVVLPTNEVTPITNYCSAMKNIKNIETQSIGIKSLSGTCDVKVSKKLEITILSLDEGSYRFFSDILSISCEPVEGVERHYSNCSNKEPIKLKPKEQGFDEATEIVFDRTETATPGAVRLVIW
jgi:hypothetical protein